MTAWPAALAPAHQASVKQGGGDGFGKRPEGEADRAEEHAEWTDVQSGFGQPNPCRDVATASRSSNRPPNPTARLLEADTGATDAATAATASATAAAATAHDRDQVANCLRARGSTP